MHRQSVDSLMPFLSVLQQPAFCIRSNGTIAFNDAAKYLIPSCAADLTRWLGSAKLHYELWDRTSALQICVSLNGSEYSSAIHALRDGTLFLLTACAASDETKNVMNVTSQVLRQPLSDLSSALYTAAQETPLPAAVSRHMHRLTRIVSNLTDLTRLNEDNLQLSICQINADDFISSFTNEIRDLCRKLGHELIVSPIPAGISFPADLVLIKRALLNLVSNALKFSSAGSPITLRIETIGSHVVFQLENQCTDGGQELLHAAFDRLSRRNLLPDPAWGIGLGLPLVNAIARIHGGMVAVETSNSNATVSLSISTIKFSNNVALGMPLILDYTGGMNQALLELSDILPSDTFSE